MNQQATATAAPNTPSSSPITKEALESALKEFFAANGLTLIPTEQTNEKYPKAYGVSMQDISRGWGVKLQTAPSACGTGIVFEATAVINLGEGWREYETLRLPVGAREFVGPYDGFHRWSTSKLLEQFGVSPECNRHFLPAIRAVFDYEVSAARAAEKSRSAAEAVGLRFKAQNNGYFNGPGYQGRISPGLLAPYITLTLSTDDPEKIAKVIEIMQSA